MTAIISTKATLNQVAVSVRKRTLPSESKALAFIPDDKILATNNIGLLDVATGKVVRKWDGPPRGVLGLDFNAGGTMLVSSGNDPHVRIWDPATGKLIASFNCHYDQIPYVQFSPDGRMLITSGHQRGAIVWNVEAQ